MKQFVPIVLLVLWCCACAPPEPEAERPYYGVTGSVEFGAGIGADTLGEPAHTQYFSDHEILLDAAQHFSITNCL